MPYPGKRKLEDFDPNASDPNDSDFEDAGPSKPSRRRSEKKSRASSKLPTKKRQRQRYGSESDIVDDDDVISEQSFSESEDEEEEAEINPRTGRAVRRATKKDDIKYEESDAEEVDFVEDTADELDELRNTPKKSKPTRNTKKLVVKLPFNHWSALRGATKPQTRRATRSRTASKPPTTPMVATRRSSRLSHDPEPHIELSSSGRRAELQRTGTKSPDQLGRRTRGGKGPRASSAGKQPRKMPSAIMEESMGHTDAASEEPVVDETEVEIEGGNEEIDEIPHEVVESVEKDAPAEDVVMEAEVEVEAEGEEPVEEVIDADRSRTQSSEGPVRRSARNLRTRATNTQSSQSKRKRGPDESSDYNPEEEVPGEEVMSDSDDGNNGRTRRKSTTSESEPLRKTRNSQRSRRHSSASEEEIDPDELAEEVHELRRATRETRQSRKQDIVYEDTRTRRHVKQVDYRIPQLGEVWQQDEEAAQTLETNNNKRRKNGGTWRPLFSVAGPFGGFGGPRPFFSGPEGEAAVGGVDSDSSDDEGQRRPRGVGGAIGMTPTSGAAPGFPLLHNPDAQQGGASGGGPANLGKVTKERKALADADPLGVDENVNFDGVGGLDDHINSLKEMVVLPLLYPEIFQQFKVTPPRGVLFHGPPGTGKTLLARALANSVSAGGKKVTFFIRKGADALSKWVGEAERQLRLLFEEARKSQPAIIFFDEIDGLAPVRSSKQEQIHASIVATLLALMDGMDGRGQVIVIGATNRPDNVDPALRRPGRFDREFYFPLPTVEARRSIIDIHTKGWDPPLKPEFKDQLADVTKGYGGADLRALCTEAALNAVQGTYPQIYKSNKKLLIDPTTIKVLAKDFMLSVNKIIPSSERSSTTSVEPLAKAIEPLLRKPLARITKILNEVLPRRAKLTALEEAQFDDRDDANGFERETMQREIDRARVFRPRLLIRGLRGMGQQHIAAALLHKFEGVFVQSFDMATLMEESSRTPEAAVVQLFKEVRRHKPSVIFLPNVDVWYETIGHNVIKTFTSLLRSIPPNDPILLLGIMEADQVEDRPNPAMMRDLFGFSSRGDYQIERPDEPARREFFQALIGYIRKRPSEFPDPENRKRRKIVALEEVPEPPPEPKVITKEDLRKQKKADRHTLNLLKQQINPVMDQIKLKYKKFRQPIIDERVIQYLYDEQDPNVLTSDLTEEQRQAQQLLRPYVLATDKRGVGGLKEVATGRFYYNLDIVVIEIRLSNGYYKRFKDFYDDIKRIAKDSKTSGDADRTIKANELVSNVQVDMTNFEQNFPSLASECEAVYLRELARYKTSLPTAGGANAAQPAPVPVPPQSMTTTENSGPVILGEQVPGRAPFLPPVTPIRRGLLSNGDASTEPQTNGSTVPSRQHDEDVQMTDSGELELSTQRGPTAAFPSIAAHSAPNTQQIHSQRAALEKMAPGSQVDDYHNSASTTTSGQKTSSSNRTSGHGNQPGVNTQSSNGTDSRIYPNFSTLGGLSGGSQIPDTQENSERSDQHQSVPDSGREVFGECESIDSDIFDESLMSDAEIPSSQHTSSQSQPASSQQFSIPRLPAHARAAVAMEAAIAQGSATAPNTTHHTSNITSILNAPEDPEYVLNESTATALHDELVRRSSGMSVEQLEQIMSVLMNAIWDNRSQWDRNVVIKSVMDAFNTVSDDIVNMQVVLEASANSSHD